MKIHSVTIINRAGQSSTIEFKTWAYRNLMELMVNEIHEDMGDCGGGARCGTCHVQVAGGQLEDDMTGHERTTLDHLTTAETSRLACQISLDSTIDGMTFTVLGDN